METWKSIAVVSKYEISQDGIVRNSKTGKILKQNITWNGYKYVKLRNGTKKLIHGALHRLLAQAFIPNPENKKCVNHKNGIKADNRLDNLEWATHSENNRHAYQMKLKKPSFSTLGGESHSSSKPVEVYRNGVKTCDFGNGRIAAQQLGVSYKSISNALNGWSKSAGGFTFKYKLCG